MTRYCSQHIIAKFTFAWLHFFCYQDIDRVFLKTLRKSIFVDNCFFSYSHVFDEEPLNPQESIHEKTHSLGRICRNEFSFIRIIFSNWRKLTFLFQLFSKFWENVIWPKKAKSAISAKIFFRKTLWGLCTETDISTYFWQRHDRFHKNNYLKKAPEFNRIFCHM